MIVNYKSLHSTLLKHSVIKTTSLKVRTNSCVPLPTYSPPVGLVLRLFSYLYNMDVVEEEALLHWREDLSREYPGKGKALFQVNQWLVLLEEADTSEDDN